MPTPNKQEQEWESTIYFKVDKDLPDTKGFIGDYNGELLNLEHGRTVHLAPAFSQEGWEARQRSAEGRGDVVVLGISHEAWTSITDILDALDPNATSAEIVNKMTQKLYWLE